ncbi:MAG: ABC transporter permease [Thermomicrobiales bacterium]|nr:ABC transporter permease [Thermomicrobiales bacterium]
MSEQTPGQRAAELFRQYGIAFVFVALFILLALTLPQFRTVANLTNVLQQNAVIGIIACAMTFAIISGGFDLSVGAGAALASVVGAKSMIEAGIPAGILGALVAGLLLGLLNGWLIAYAGVNPFVATLGTATIVRGLIYVSTNATPFFGVPMSFTVVGLGRTGPLPNATWIFLAVALILAFVLHQTRFGHYVYAIGGNIVAAAEMGIPVRRVKLLVYVLVGFCAAIGGIILTGQTASGQPQAALNYELAAITAVIVGGASLGGGRGTVGGTILGVFLLGLVSNALNLYGVSAFWQPVATGTILVLAVAIDGISRRSVFSLS